MSNKEVCAVEEGGDGHMGKSWRVRSAFGQGANQDVVKPLQNWIKLGVPSTLIRVKGLFNPPSDLTTVRAESTED